MYFTAPSLGKDTWPATMVVIQKRTSKARVLLFDNTYPLYPSSEVIYNYYVKN